MKDIVSVNEDGTKGPSFYWKGGKLVQRVKKEKITNEFWAMMDKKGEFRHGYLHVFKEGVESDFFGESYGKDSWNPEGWKAVKVKLTRVK